jgi:hypothetical protein
MEMPTGPIDKDTAWMLFQLLLLENGAQIADKIPDRINTDKIFMEEFEREFDGTI